MTKILNVYAHYPWEEGVPWYGDYDPDFMGRMIGGYDDEDEDVEDELVRRYPGLQANCPTCTEGYRGDQHYLTEGKDTFRKPAKELPWNSPGRKGIRVRCDCNTQTALFRAYAKAGIGVPDMRWHWLDFQGNVAARNQVMDWVAMHKGAIPEGAGLGIQGDHYGGQQKLLSLAVRSLLKLGYDKVGVRWISFAELIEKRGQGWTNPEVRAAWEKVALGSSLLAIVNITTPTSNSVKSTLSLVAQGRALKGKATLFTTDLPQDTMLGHYGDDIRPLYDRAVLVDLGSQRDAFEFPIQRQMDWFRRGWTRQVY